MSVCRFTGFLALLCNHCYSFHRTFADLSNIFLRQSLLQLLFSMVACNATPACHLCYVNYITPFPCNLSLGHLWATELNFGVVLTIIILLHYPFFQNVGSAALTSGSTYSGNYGSAFHTPLPCPLNVCISG